MPKVTEEWLISQKYVDSCSSKIYCKGILSVWCTDWGWYLSVASGNPISFYDKPTSKYDKGPLTQTMLEQLVQILIEGTNAKSDQ